MPISAIKKLPKHARHMFERVMSSLKGKKNPRTGKPYTDEQRGRIAWSAVKKKYKRKSEGRWSAKK